MSEIITSHIRAETNLVNFLGSGSTDAEFANRVINGGNLARNPDTTRALVEFGQVREKGYTIDVAKCLGVGLAGYARGGRFVCYPIHVSSQGAFRQTEYTETLLNQGIGSFLQTPGLDLDSVRPFIGGGRNNFMSNREYPDGLSFVKETLKKAGIKSDSRVFTPNTSQSVGNLFMGEGRVLWVASNVK